jgi:Tc5 transposase DNA-binding domain
LLLQWVLLLAEMGIPITKTGMIELANEMITDTLHSKKLSKFNMKRNIKNEDNVGESWYKGFKTRHSEFLKRSKSDIRDQNRMNWCTYENFANMYDGIIRQRSKQEWLRKLWKKECTMRMEIVFLTKN